MATADIICILFIIVVTVLGTFMGLARQLMFFVSGIVGAIVALFILSPVFKLLMSLGFFSAMVEGLGAKINPAVGFLSAITQSSGKTAGLLISEYIFKFLVYIILCIALGLLIKILKRIIIKIVSLPGIKTVDRILGTIFAFTMGTLLIIVTFSIIGIFKDSPSVANFLSNIAPSGSLIDKYIIRNLEIISEYFMRLWNFIIGKI